MGRSQRNYGGGKQSGYGSSRKKNRRSPQTESLPHMALTEDHFRTTQPARVKQFEARNPRQQAYFDSIMNNTLTFGVGPEGTGKTFVALAAAVAMYNARQIDTIICARAVVGPGEDPGFFPGEPLDKISPWLAACREVLDLHFGKRAVESMISNDRVRFVPFSLMRGINWRNAFVLLDEAQNVTPSQMRLFLTRHVTGSKMVVDGGLAQKDTPDNVENGLADALNRFHNKPNVGVVQFQNCDITRSPFVRMVVNAYDQDGIGRESAHHPKDLVAA